MIERHAFRAMGTDVQLLVDGPGDGFAAAEAELHRLESLLTRFRESELTRLNRDGAIDAGHDLLRVVMLALDARERTGGLFDPTVHDAVVSAGYDRTFAELGDASPGPPHRCGGTVRVTGSRIELEPGARLDLGGIAKGYAAECAAQLLALTGPCLVNAGGDIAVRGGAWPVGVEDATIELSEGGLATSGRDRRRWRGGHHLIDPRTGAPAHTDLLRVTVLAADAVEAEVAATACFLGGSLDGAVVVAEVRA